VEPTDALAIITGLPNYLTGQGCRLYQYSFSRRREQRLAGTHLSGGSEVLPSIWRSRVAFVRTPSGGGGPGRMPLLEIATSGSARPLRGGTWSAPTPLGPGGPGPIGLSLRGSQLAFGWVDDEGHCPGSPGVKVEIGARAEMWTEDVTTGVPSLVDQFCSDDGNGRFYGPTFTDVNRLVYISVREADEALVQDLLGHSPTRIVSLKGRTFYSLASTRGRLILAEGPRGERTRIITQPGPR
jgi:hypothetical protein